jgi:hypothetical protein
MCSERRCILIIPKLENKNITTVFFAGKYHYCFLINLLGNGKMDGFKENMKEPMCCQVVKILVWDNEKCMHVQRQNQRQTPIRYYQIEK